MYNSDLPTRSELPSSAQLLRSSAIALVAAIALLLTTILPAEYGIDPTGVGNLLGLKRMGEIKVSLAEEARASEAAPAAVAISPVAGEGVVAIAPVAAPIPESDADMGIGDNFDSRSFILAPGGAAEIKLVMVAGAEVNYRWQVKGGRVNYDTHGDSGSIEYHGYDKGRAVAAQSGVLTAAFDGSHGWFWRNRSGGSVTVTLDVEGAFLAVKRVM